MSAVGYRVDDKIAVITMDQPDTRNALTPAVLNGLGDGLEAAGTDPQVRALVITHTGPAFCAGADLRDSPTQDEPARYELAELLGRIEDLPKPVIARIAGHCMGGGVGLAAACDLSIAAEDARFGFTEVRIGVAPAIISVVCLPKLRRGDALELFLTGERIPARRAAEVGLITSAVPSESLDESVQALLDKVTAGAPVALAAAKKLVFDVPLLGRDDAFAETSRLSKSLFASEEAAEGMAAFRERRTPSWNL
ncbi:MAG: enoyl-CoA hydratase/isomerase family protein [Acidimicrobiales bacterium]|nr:enoyl-CoA hydratase/isomerase family protein [Acidimicrobiales bacterium]